MQVSRLLHTTQRPLTALLALNRTASVSGNVLDQCTRHTRTDTIAAEEPHIAIRCARTLATLARFIRDSQIRTHTITQLVQQQARTIGAEVSLQETTI